MASRLSTVLLFSLAFTTAGSARAAPQPPLRAVWSWQMTDTILIDVSVDGAVAYLAYSEAIVALDLNRGRARWRKELPAHPRSLFSSRFADDQSPGATGLILAVNYDGLYRLAADTGKTQWHVPSNDPTAKPLLGDGVIYWACAQRALCAVDGANGTLRWRREMGPCPESVSRDWSIRIAWRDKGILQVMLPEGGGREVDARTGRTLATFAENRDGVLVQMPNEAALPGGRLLRVFSDSVRLEGHDRTVWEVPLGKGYRLGGRLVIDDTVLIGAGPAIAALRLADGKKLWESDPQVMAEETFGQMLYRLGDDLLVIESSGVHRLTHGQPPPPPSAPSDRAREARALVARFARLTTAERRRLVALGSEAADALIAGLHRWLAHPPKWEERRPVPVSRGLGSSSMAADALIAGLDLWLSEPPVYPEAGLSLLRKVATPKQLPALRRLRHSAEMARASSDARERLDSILATMGDEELLLETLAAARRSGVYRMADYQRRLLRDSAHPQVVDFFLRALADPEATWDVRELAFVALPLHGGSPGRAAVRAAKCRRESHQPLTDEQEVLTAAFDAYFCAGQRSCSSAGSDTVVRVTFPRGISPVRLTSCGVQSEVIGLDAPSTGRPWSHVHEVSFTRPRIDFAGEFSGSIEVPPDFPVVAFDTSGSRARVELVDMFGQLAGGGYDIELAKLDGEWFVVSVERVFIS